MTSRRSLPGCMQNSYNFYIDTHSLKIIVFHRPRSDPRNSGVRDNPVVAVDVARIMRRAGLMPLEPTRAEATRIEETPGIEWSMFTKLFGGYLRSEWPQCSNVWGYSDFLCADIIAQPFVPRAAGKPGLLFRLPTVIEAPRTEKRSIYVLSNMVQNPALCYRGNYTTVPLPEVEIDWTDLPHSVRILKLCYSSDKGFLTSYSLRTVGPSALVHYGHPPPVHSVHGSN